MPFPRRIALANRRFPNPQLRRLGRRLPPFAIIRHVGRRSGRTYETPVWAFRSPEAARGVDAVIALTYGADVDWLRNIEAAGGAFELIRAGRTYHGDDVRRLTGGAGARLVPAPIRLALRVLQVDDFVVVRVRPAE